eukprot:COSAG04_NODE_2727_length_3670_cov_1.703724_1_plen_1059_part_01
MRDFQRVLLVCLGLCFAQRAMAQTRPTMTCGTYGGLACPIPPCSAGMTQTSADGPGANALWDASEDPGELAVPTVTAATAGYAADGTRDRHSGTGWPYAALVIAPPSDVTDPDGVASFPDSIGIQVYVCDDYQTCSGDWGDDETNAATTGPYALGTTYAFPIGASHVYYIATETGTSDPDSEPCHIMVIVSDVESPSVDCPDDITTTTGQVSGGLQVGESTATVNLQYTDAQYMDNVVPVADTDDLSGLHITMQIKSGGAASSTYYIDPGTTDFNIGVTEVEYKVRDGTGFTAMWSKCSITVTVLDQEEPGQLSGPRGTIGCPSAVDLPRAQDTQTGQNYREVTLAYSDMTAYDNSGTIAQSLIRFQTGTSVPDSVAAAAEGSHQFAVGNFGAPQQHTIKYSAVDPSDNVGECSVTITITDAETPVLTCPPDLYGGDGDGFSTDAGQDYYEVTLMGEDSGLTQGATCADNTGCGIIEAHYGAIDGPLITEGAAAATYQFVLDAGLTQTHSVFFVAKDSPCEQCQITNGQNDAACSFFCDSNNNPDPGNTGSCEWQVRVKDTEDPVVTCPTDITASSTTGTDANSVGDSLPLSNPLPTDTPAGAAGIVSGFAYKTLTLQAATVTDNSDAGTASALPYTATMLVDGVVTEIAADTGTRFNIGSTDVTYTATDASGNTGSCTITVTVVDVEDPILVCPNAQALTTDATQPYVMFALPAPTMSDNSGSVTYDVAIDTEPSIVPGGQSLPNAKDALNPFYYGETVVTYTAYDRDQSDNALRTATCSLTIVVTDDEAPVLDCRPSFQDTTDPGDPVGFPYKEITIQGSDATVTDNAVFGGIAALIVTVSIDGVDLSVGTTPHVFQFPIGTTTVVHTATDNAAHPGTTTNTGTCQYTVTIQDNEAPDLTCPADISVPTTAHGDWDSPRAGNPSGAPHATVNLVAATVQDNSGDVLSVVGTTGPTVFDIGVHSVEYSASDNYGQTTTCTRTVTVLDQEAPILVCPSDISVNLLENDENYRSLSVASDLGLATVTDNNDLNGLAPPNAVVTAEILMSTRLTPTDVTVG